MIIQDNMANMCAKVTSTYMEFTLAFGPKPEFSFSFKFHLSSRWECTLNKETAVYLRTNVLSIQQFYCCQTVMVILEYNDSLFLNFPI